MQITITIIISKKVYNINNKLNDQKNICFALFSAQKEISDARLRYFSMQNVASTSESTITKIKLDLLNTNKIIAE